MVQFIDDHRARLGVEPICAVLPTAPSTYHRHRHQRTDPTRRSARAQRDDQRCGEIQRGDAEHQQVYGPRKVWQQLRRDGVCVARCTVARLMRAMGLAGAGGRPVDLVDRQFVATRPNQRWVSDFTCVATWGGVVYVAFVIERSNNGSGRRPPGGCRVRRPLCHVACLRPWVVVGSVRAVGCRRSAWRRRRLVTCALMTSQ